MQVNHRRRLDASGILSCRAVEVALRLALSSSYLSACLWHCITISLALIIILNPFFTTETGEKSVKSPIFLPPPD